MVDNDMSQSLMTVSELARLLHVHNNTVRRWSDQGLIKAYRVSRRGDRRFRRQDITNFLDKFNTMSKDGESRLSPEARRASG